MSVPLTITLPQGYRRVALPGRLGRVAAVAGTSEPSLGSALLIPGFTGSKEDYFAPLPQLLRLGWSAVAADLPGMAESDGPQGAEHYSLELLAADVAAMLAQCSPDGRPVHLVGHSVGGLIAREAALLVPNSVASLTLVNSGKAPVRQRAQDDIAALEAALATHTPEQVYAMKKAVDAASGQAADAAEIADFLQRRWASTSPGHLLAMARIAVGAPDRAVELRRACQAGMFRVMVLYGELDEQSWTAHDFAALAAEIGAERRAIRAAAHSPAVEAPMEFAEALHEFWRAANPVPR